MTHHQLLADAVAAARARAERGVDDGAATRLRLRESFAKPRGRRRLGIVAAVIASLFGSTAFALVAHYRAPEPVIAPPAVAPAIDEPAATTPPPVRVDRELAIDRVIIPPPVRPPVQRRIEPALPAQPEVTIPAPRSRDLAAYRLAHEAHFRGSDPRAALAAWDAYLAEFPDGQLAPDARYNRALVLVKLGRHAEAAQALAPFAAAAPGSYRQREAAKLVEALRRPKAAR